MSIAEHTQNSISILTLCGLCSKLLVSKSKTKTYKNKNISLFVTLKVARAVSQSQRVVSAIYFKIKGGFTTLGSLEKKLYCEAFARSILYPELKMTRILRIAGICSVILLFVLLSTDPQRLPSIILVSPFILLFVIIFTGILFMLGAYAMTQQRKIRIGLIGAAAPVVLLVLQSLGQLTVRDVLAILILFCATYFYISKLSVRSVS